MSISVIIPAYNAAAFITRAVESCLIQSEVSEIIVIEDGSSDNSYDLIKTLAVKEKKIRLYTHPKRQNLGPAHTRNLGLSKATSKYITFLDADDYYLENRFTESIILLQNQNELDAVYCKAQNVGDYSDRYPKYISEVTKNEKPLSDIISGKQSIALWTILYRKEAVDKLPLFDPDLLVGQDLQYVFHSLKKLKISHCGIPDPLMVRTINESNRTSLHGLSTHIKCRRKIFTYWYKQLEKEAFTIEEKHHITKHYSSYILQDALPRLYYTPLLGRVFLRLFYVYNRLA